MKIHHVNNVEDYKDWQADKMLFEAMKSRKEIDKEYSYEALLRKWVQFYRELDAKHGYDKD